jgi:hypothetical protein
MPMLRLILDPEGAAVDVDDAVLIGACATQLAAQFGYPLSDSAVMPVLYQLRLSTGGRLLPNNQLFRDLQLASGTHFTLVSSTASAPTRPVHAVGLPSGTQPSVHRAFPADGVGERSLEQEPSPHLRLPVWERAWLWRWHSGT